MNILELHNSVWQQLNARRERLPHALLLTGRQGIGAFDLARAFAESLLCESPSSSQAACGNCPACRWLTQGNHPDFRLIQPDALTDADEEEGVSGKKKPSRQITIDQVRDLDDFLHVGTHRHGLRVVLLYPAEAMNRATANSLLKSLEEPSSNTLFILVSYEHERLLPTIRSRCQQLPVATPEGPLATAWLSAFGVDNGARWLALAGGAPLLAVELASGEERELIDTLIGVLEKGAGLNPLDAATSIDRIVKADKQASGLIRLVGWTQKWLVDLNHLKAGFMPRYFLEQATLLNALAARTSACRLLAFHRKALQYRLQCQQPLNSRLFLEDFFLNYAALFEPVRERHG